MNNDGSSSDGERNALGDGTLAGATVSTTSKEKRHGWFHSLTRRKKSAPAVLTSSGNSNAHGSVSLQNNNNEVPGSLTEMATRSAIASSSGHSTAEDPCVSTGALCKRKDKKNVFQRIRKKMEFRLSAIRPWRSVHETDTADSGTTDATYEFVARAHIDPSLPFTHDYKRFIVKKWLERSDGPNSVMYQACSQMLNQVWYWGEISRRDAQRQLTDKPTGSFLVRDSETSGSQFTLSFRIANVTLHYRLEYWGNYWHFEELRYESTVEMIQDILHRCTNDNFVCFVKVPNEMQPPFPVILKYPLSRYLNMPKLQDLCRRVIQKQVPADKMTRLPVPAPLLDYLSIRPELVFQC